MILGLVGQHVHAAMISTGAGEADFIECAPSGNMMDIRFACVLCGFFKEDHVEDCGVTDWSMGWVVVSKHPNPKPRSYVLQHNAGEGFAFIPASIVDAQRSEQSEQFQNREPDDTYPHT